MTRRTNPINFEVAPGAREAIDMRTRTAASMYSPVKHRTIAETTLGSPHNYQVILLPEFTPTPEEFRSFSRPDRIVLIHRGQPRAGGDPKMSESESIYTAFTYMHRLGDEAEATVLDGCRDYSAQVSPFVFPTRAMSGGYGKVWNNPPNAVLVQQSLAARDKLRALWQATCAALAALPGSGLATYTERERYVVLEELSSIRVNSKMVRDGYADSDDQAAADLFGLAELTPVSRPLLRPYAKVEEIGESPGHFYGGYRAQDAEIVTPGAMAILNTFFAQHNLLWRRWHDLFIRANYGAVVDI
jgi:hypothetical protein